MTLNERIASVCNTIVSNLEKAEKGKKVLYLYTKSDYPALSIIETVKVILAEEGKTVVCETKEVSPSAIALIFSINE